jgi:hypothetical protein
MRQGRLAHPVPRLKEYISNPRVGPMEVQLIAAGRLVTMLRGLQSTPTNPPTEHTKTYRL